MVIMYLLISIIHPADALLRLDYNVVIASQLPTYSSTVPRASVVAMSKLLLLSGTTGSPIPIATGP